MFRLWTVVFLMMIRGVHADSGHVHVYQFFEGNLELDDTYAQTMLDHTGTEIKNLYDNDRELVRAESMKFLQFLNKGIENDDLPLTTGAEITLLSRVLATSSFRFDRDTEMVDQIVEIYQKSEINALFPWIKEEGLSHIARLSTPEKDGLLSRIIDEGKFSEEEVIRLLLGLKGREDVEENKAQFTTILQQAYDKDDPEKTFSDDDILYAAEEIGIELTNKDGSPAIRGEKSTSGEANSAQKPSPSAPLIKFLIIGLLMLLIVGLLVLLKKNKS